MELLLWQENEDHYKLTLDFHFRCNKDKESSTNKRLQNNTVYNTDNTQVTFNPKNFKILYVINSENCFYRKLALTRAKHVSNTKLTPILCILNLGTYNFVVIPQQAHMLIFVNMFLYFSLTSWCPAEKRPTLTDGILHG